MAQMLPVGHIVLVHRRAPAEDVVADEEVVHHANNHRDDRDAEKDADFLIKLVDADLMRGGQRALDQVVERRIPGVDRHPDFHQKPGDEDDERGAENRPVLPAVRAVDKPEQREHADAKQIVSVEHQIVERPEARRADRHIFCDAPVTRSSQSPPPACQKITASIDQIKAEIKNGPGLGKKI